MAFRRASICSGVSIPGIRAIAIGGDEWSDLSMSDIPAIAMETGSPRAASHRCINFISSDCELLIRAPSDRRSLFSVCDGISAVISTACE